MECAVHGKQLLIHLGVFLQSVGWIHKNSVCFVRVDLQVNVGSWNCLLLSVWSIGVCAPDGGLQVFLGVLVLRDLSEHHRVVVLLSTELVFKAHNLETLATNLAAVHWAFSRKVKDLLMRVRIILNTRAHANDNTPGGVRGEDEHWVVDCAKLRVDCRLHFVPLVEVN